eukprot:SAG11_NODE_7794_length_1095_cov_1.756024_1_plen_105_part_10
MGNGRHVSTRCHCRERVGGRAACAQTRAKDSRIKLELCGPAEAFPDCSPKVTTMVTAEIITFKTTDHDFGRSCDRETPNVSSIEVARKVFTQSLVLYEGEEVNDI